MKSKITWKRLACLFYAVGGLSGVLAAGNGQGLTAALFTLSLVMVVAALATLAANM